MAVVALFLSTRFTMKGIRMRPDQEGLRSALFDLEADIMEVVWAKRWARFTVADVHRELARNRDIAYTTVMTTVNRLVEKELLDRRRDGKRYVYTARMDRSQFDQAVAREMMQSFSQLAPEEAVALLVDRVSEGDAQELKRLEALIRKRRKELGS